MLIPFLSLPWGMNPLSFNPNRFAGLPVILAIKEWRGSTCSCLPYLSSK
jgi:hypothetical protein